MNPLTNMKNVLKLSEQELHTGNKSSWHDQYKDSAWIFVAGFSYDLSEGDLICIFSQYGEIVHINLVRDKDTGKSRGFCFICYEDQRSTVLAVDNLNGIKLLNRSLRVDHVAQYKVPKKALDEVASIKKDDPEPEERPKVKVEPEPHFDVRETLADQIEGNIKLPMRLPIYSIKDEPESVVSFDVGSVKAEKQKKSKKEKKHKKKSKKKKKKRESSDSDMSTDSESERSAKKSRK